MRSTGDAERFVDRRDAGRVLAGAVAASEPELHRPVVLALPRGGVPVAFEVATVLGAPLDVVVARKVGAPGHPEYGIGAIAECDVRVADRAALVALGIDDRHFDRLAQVERRELDRRVERYRAGRPLPDARDRDIVVVDDGLATGVTAEAALAVARTLAPRRIVLAVPVAAADTAARLGALADGVVCVIRRSDFASVGQWYDDFTQTSDDEVIELLRLARTASSEPTHDAETAPDPGA